MKYLSLLLGIFLFFSLLSVSDTKAQNERPLSAMSYNIKYYNPSDTLNSWDNRRDQIVNLISFYEPDFLGTQEGLFHQIQFLDNHLTKMQWIGVGRADGAKEGEFSAIFYNTDRFELVANSDSTIWLSKTPDVPSKSWDAALPRILTWGKFRDRKTGNYVFVFNTHFDHRGEKARLESTNIILDTIEKVTSGEPVILTGDFNFTENEPPYDLLTADKSGLKDAFYSTKQPHLGPVVSYTGFTVGDESENRRIDYIFTNQDLQVLKHTIIANFQGNRYPSDHLPVYAKFKFQE